KLRKKEKQKDIITTLKLNYPTMKKISFSAQASSMDMVNVSSKSMIIRSISNRQDIYSSSIISTVRASLVTWEPFSANIQSISPACSSADPMKAAQLCYHCLSIQQ